VTTKNKPRLNFLFNTVSMFLWVLLFPTRGEGTLRIPHRELCERATLFYYNISHEFYRSVFKWCLRYDIFRFLSSVTVIVVAQYDNFKTEYLCFDTWYPLLSIHYTFQSSNAAFDGSISSDCIKIKYLPNVYFRTKEILYLTWNE